MYQLLMGLYILICVLLVVVILMQSGRGGGLVETASAAEAIFGGKTNIYMVKITMVIGFLFLALALGLNYYAVQKNKSIIEKLNRSAKASAKRGSLGLPAKKVKTSKKEVAKAAGSKSNVKVVEPVKQEAKSIAKETTKKQAQPGPVASDTAANEAPSN